MCSLLALGTIVARIRALRWSEGSNIPIVATTLFLRFSCLILSVVAVTSYVVVNFRAPRPWQVHVYGLTLVFRLLLICLATAAENFEHVGEYLLAWTGYVAVYGAWVAYKAVLCRMMIRKVAMLESPNSRFHRVQFWDLSMMVWNFISAGYCMLGWILAIGILLRGVQPEDVLAGANPLPPYPPEDLKVSFAEWVAATSLIMVGTMSVCVLLVSVAAFAWTSFRLKRGVIPALIGRGTAEDLLAKERYGKHCDCPETPGQCWCVQLYGEPKEWGCFSFEAWHSNVEKALELDLDLVVAFFPGQVGQGVVEWDDLPTEDLWDGHGLGGSQKGEVAYLRKRGINFASEDLVTVQSWLRSRWQILDARSISPNSNFS